MTTRPWQRTTARVLLMTFTMGVLGCGGGTTQEPATATTMPATATTNPPNTASPPPAPEPPPPPPPSPPSTLPAQPPDQLSKDELRELVAPVALYPDVVLSSLLPATTYPEQVHEAAEYVGDAATVERIPEDRSWDGSIVGLLQFPDVVRWLDQNPAWTDEMGQAVTYQQADVLQAIQDYRKSVQKAGNLQSNQYQKVRVASNQDVYIEPARPDIVYVPSYDPVVAVQPQPAPEPGINPWIAFGGGAVVGALGAWALYSVFDDDDHDYNYYGGRRIHGYDNYYYYRGRRPRAVAWAPRQRPWRRNANWQRPRKLVYAQPVPRPGRRPVALRPPTKRVNAPAPLSTQAQRDQRQLNRQERQQMQQQRQMEQRQQRQDAKQAQQQRQQEQKQARQQRQQDKKMQQQEQRRQQQESRQQRQADQRQRQQEQRQQQQQQRQDRQQRQQEQRQGQQQQRQQRQEQQRQQQQERRQQQQERRQEQKQLDGGQGRGGGGGGGGQHQGGGGGGGKQGGGGGGGNGGGGGGGGGNKKKHKND